MRGDASSLLFAAAGFVSDGSAHVATDGLLAANAVVVSASANAMLKRLKPNDLKQTELIMMVLLVK